MRYAIKVLGLVSVLVLSACGSEGGKDFGQFVGTWRATSGTVTRVCPDDDPYTEVLAGDIVWINGVSSDLVAKSPITPCRLKAVVTGATASGVSGQGCTESDDAGGRVTVTLTSYMFVVSSDGLTAAEISSGQVTHEDHASTKVCSFDETASYGRAAGI